MGIMSYTRGSKIGKGLRIKIQSREADGCKIAGARKTTTQTTMRCTHPVSEVGTFLNPRRASAAHIISFRFFPTHPKITHFPYATKRHQKSSTAKGHACKYLLTSTNLACRRARCLATRMLKESSLHLLSQIDQRVDRDDVGEA